MFTFAVHWEKSTTHWFYCQDSVFTVVSGSLVHIYVKNDASVPCCSQFFSQNGFVITAITPVFVDGFSQHLC